MTKAARLGEATKRQMAAVKRLDTLGKRHMAAALVREVYLAARAAAHEARRAR